MPAPDIEGKFFAILSSLLTVPRERLGRDSSRESVEQWDSLKHMHLMMTLEEEFGIEFDDNELSGLAGAGALLDAVVAKVGA
jgi:acyl carrier protein